MPNWCENYVMVAGDKNVIKSLVETGFDFNTVVPEPTTADDDSNDWYSWRVDNWGCKWNRDEQCVPSVDDNSTSAAFYFVTPWDPPIAIYEALEQMNIYVEAFFFEPGLGLVGGYTEREMWEVDIISCSEEYGSTVKFFEYDPLGQNFEEYFRASEYYQSDEEDEGTNE